MLTTTGSLRVRPLSATLVHNTEHFGKMSPYVMFKLGGLTHKTIAAKKQHLSPSWDEEFFFDITDKNWTNLEVILKHKELIHDDLIGQGSINLGTWLSGNKGNKFSEWIPLFYKEKDAGSILLEMNFTPSTLGTGIVQAPLVGQTLNTGISTTTTTTTTPVIIQDAPNVHTETIHVQEPATFIKDQPLVYEKEIIKERPIIQTKEIVESTQPITIEKPELRENIMKEVREPVVIRDQPIMRTEAATNVTEKPILEGQAIISKETEFQKLAPVFINAQPEVYKKDVVTEKPIIHEKDIIHVEKPIIVEKPEFIQKEFHHVERPVTITQDTLVHPEKQVFTDTAPLLSDKPNVVQQPTQLIQGAPTFVKEKTDIFQKEIIHEKPIIHEQPILHTQKEVIQEKPEFQQTRILVTEQPILKQEPVLNQRNVIPPSNLSGKPKGDTLAQPSSP